MKRLLVAVAVSLFASTVLAQSWTTPTRNYTAAEVANLRAEGFRPLGDGSWIKEVGSSTFQTGSCANGSCGVPLGNGRGASASRNPSPIPSLRLPPTASDDQLTSSRSGSCPTTGGEPSAETIKAIIAAVVVELREDGSLRGPKGDQGDPGRDGADGQAGPKGDKGDKGEKGDPAVVDYDRIVSEVVSIIRADLPVDDGDSAPAWSHIVLVAPKDASYSRRLLEEFERARSRYSGLRFTEPPVQHVGPIPALVAYHEGTPLKVWRGEREVSEALSRIARGEYDSFLSAKE